MADPKKYSVGFTGTRKGVNALQLKVLRYILNSLHSRGLISEVHHGDCLGADLQFHTTMVHLGDTPIHVHPLDKTEIRANAPDDPHITRHQPLPYLERNRAIVMASDILVAVPAELDEQQKGGTWSTWRLSFQKHVPSILIQPNGLCRVRCSGGSTEITKLLLQMQDGQT